MKYEEVIPIKSRISSVWIVYFDNKDSILLVMDRKFKIEDVVNYVKVHNPKNTKFKVQVVDVGTFEISKIIDMFSPDARKIDQDMEVSI